MAGRRSLNAINPKGRIRPGRVPRRNGVPRRTKLISPMREDKQRIPGKRGA